MFCGNAAGDVLDPYVVFKSKHLYMELTRNGPKGARYNRTKSGWFDEATFEDWFFNMLLPHAQQQEGKKVLLGDNLSSHLSEAVVKACKENDIAFVCLLPNATHLLQDGSLLNAAEVINCKTSCELKSKPDVWFPQMWYIPIQP